MHVAEDGGEGYSAQLSRAEYRGNRRHRSSQTSHALKSGHALHRRLVCRHESSAKTAMYIEKGTATENACHTRAVS